MEEREIIDWITVNGNHVPMYKGESPSMAAKRFLKQKTTTDKIVDKNQSDKERTIKKNKEEANKLNKQNSLPKRLFLPDISMKDANKKTDILDLDTWKRYRFASDVTGVYAFAGKGSSKEFRDAEKYARRYGGKKENWQHCAGFAAISNGNDKFDVEVHWVQIEGGEIREAFIKRRIKK